MIQFANSSVSWHLEQSNRDNKQENSIVGSPGSNNVKICISYASPRPHILTVFESGKVTCDCRNKESLNICAHSVAVADTIGSLLKLINWYKSSKQSVNLWKLSKSSLLTPKHPGAKPHLKQKRSKSKNIPVLTYSKSPVTVTPTSSSSSLTPSSSVSANPSLPVLTNEPVPYNISPENSSMYYHSPQTNFPVYKQLPHNPYTPPPMTYVQLSSSFLPTISSLWHVFGLFLPTSQ